MDSNRCLVIMTGAFHTDGGIAAVNRLTIKAIADQGYSLDILSLIERDATLDQRYLSNGTQATCRGFAGNKFLFTLAVWRAVLRNSYEYIFVDHVNLASILFPFIWRMPDRYVVWLCGIEVFPPRPDWQGRLGLQGAGKCLAISEFTFQSVASRFPDLNIKVCDLSLDPVRHVPPETLVEEAADVELTALDGSRQKLDLHVILHVGRMSTFERFKGQEVLIDAFPRIYQKYPDAQLVLAGKGDDLERLRARARALPSEVHSRIFMPGYVADDLLERIYCLCYLFAMPSIGEGFGLVYLEAMSRGKPCIGARADATPFVIREGETGLLVDDPRSLEEVAHAVLWLFNHPVEASRMGRAGYELVQSYYLFHHFKERFLKIISGV